jgi:hypothetical protein
MRYLNVLYSLSLLISCQSQQDKIIGKWKVENLSEYPLSISNYGDMIFDVSSIVLFDGEHLTISNPDSMIENYKYTVEDGELIIIYSDYGIPLTIEELTATKLTLTGGGSGNTEKERSRYFKLELKR